jgi:hypothetical protein
MASELVGVPGLEPGTSSLSGLLPYQVSSVSTCAKPGSGVEWLPGSSRDDPQWTTSSGTKRARLERGNSGCGVSPRRAQERSCRVPRRQRGVETAGATVHTPRGPGRQPRLAAACPFRSVGVGALFKTVRCRSFAGSLFHICPRFTGIIQRLGSSAGSSPLSCRVLRPGPRQ